MSQLLKYLNENHPNAKGVESSFKDKFGVNVKQEDYLYLFKYGIIESRWIHDITWECRGAILRHLPNNTWEFASRPWDKFFNQHEGHCPLFGPTAFKTAAPDLAVVEKADGSCIQYWFDTELNHWRVSTLGTITTCNVSESQLTFEDLFRQTVTEINDDSLDKDYTYLFELCCDENRIITKYKLDHAVLLGARNKKTGKYLSYQMLSEVRKNFYNTRLPIVKNLKNINVSNIDEMRDWVEQQSKTDSYGEYPEGFVLYNINEWKPVAKLKNETYVSLHHVGGGDLKHSKKQVTNAVFSGYLDDIYGVLNNNLTKFADEMVEIAKNMNEYLSQKCELMNNFNDELKFINRKEFAIHLQQNVDKKYHSYFFENLNGEDLSVNSDPEKIFKWMKKNYEKILPKSS